MSEELSEGAESGKESTGVGADPAAMALALNGADSDAGIAQEARAYLRNQSTLIDIQKHHLHKHLRLSLWEKRLGVLLRIATAFIGIAVASGLGWMIWNAANSDELIVDAFSVPPDLAARGLTGQAVAAELVDQLADMQALTVSNRAPQSFANSFSDGIKLEIPETGISLSELDRFLREKLGHGTHISGEVIRTPAGLVLKARAGSLGSAKVAGAEADSDALTQQLAGEIFKLTQPYRYGIYLGIQGHQVEAIAHLKALAKTGSAEERAWDNVGIATYIFEQEGTQSGIEYYNRARALDPQNIFATNNLSGAEYRLGLFEQGLQDIKTALPLLSSRGARTVRSEYIPFLRLQTEGNIDSYLGAFHDASQKWILASGEVGARGSNGVSAQLARNQAAEHDIAAARATMKDPLSEKFGRVGLQTLLNISTDMFIDTIAEDWFGVLSQVPALEPLSQKYAGLPSNFPAMTDPLTAYAQAKLGRFSEAEARIKNTPDYCYPCLIVRAQIAALQRQDARADWWFDRAAKDGPSLPFAHFEWGRALMQRGNLTGAIAKFKLANQKGPHFADPLEMWGEVLIAQNRSDLAIAKFTEANKYAPNWGRLHLKWGEALSYLGKSAEAQKQFARAGELDLTSAEKSERAKVSK